MTAIRETAGQKLTEAKTHRIQPVFAPKKQMTSK